MSVGEGPAMHRTRVRRDIQLPEPTECPPDRLLLHLRGTGCAEAETGKYNLLCNLRNLGEKLVL